MPSKFNVTPEEGGWLAIILFFLLLFLMCAGGFVGSPADDFDAAQRQNEKDRQALLGDLPGLVGATVVTTTTLPGATTTTAAAATTTTAAAAATATTAAPQQQQQQPAATAPPATEPPPPPATCGYGGPISISGGDTGSVGPSGGSFNATGSSVSAFVSGLPVCGQHYALVIRASHSDGGFASVTDCKLDGGSITNNSAQSGQPVSVTLLLPPNQCG